MSWLGLLRGDPPRGSPVSREGGEDAARRVEGAAPGAGLLFPPDIERPDLIVLDLGAASAMSFRVYRTIARQIRFADLFSDWIDGGWVEALEAIRRDSSRSVDRILAWDTLDRLSPEGRRHLMEVLSELAAPGARLHMVIRGSREAAQGTLRFGLSETDRMVYEVGDEGGGGRLGPPLLPSELHAILSPFEVENAFTLRGELREYVAVRRGGE